MLYRKSVAKARIIAKALWKVKRHWTSLWIGCGFLIPGKSWFLLQQCFPSLNSEALYLWDCLWE